MTRIHDNPMYSVDTAGNVYSHVNNAGNARKEPFKLTPGKDQGGYLLVGMHGVAKKTHRLVSAAFISNPASKPQVNHKNGNKEDNSVSNLEWVTAKENTQHAHQTGLTTIARGENATMATLSNDECVQLITQLLAGEDNETVAKQFGLHSRYVSLIRHKKKMG